MQTFSKGSYLHYSKFNNGYLGAYFDTKILYFQGISMYIKSYYFYGKLGNSYIELTFFTRDNLSIFKNSSDSYLP